MSLFRKLAAALVRTLTRASAAPRGRATSPHTDVTDGYEAWLAESFPRLHQS